MINAYQLSTYVAIYQYNDCVWLNHAGIKELFYISRYTCLYCLHEVTA